MLAVLVVAAVIALFVSLAVFAYRKNQERIAALQQLALSKGWEFSRPDPYGLPGRWPGAPFNQGYARNAENVMTGKVGGRDLVAFDYSYKEDSTDSEGHSTTSTYCFGVVALGMPCPLPELELYPEHVFSRIGHALGMQDIELESEEFNRRYRVKCPDPKLATDVLTPRTMEMLIAAPKMHFRFVGGDVVCYESGQLKAPDVLVRAGALERLIDGVPSFVWKDHGMTEMQPLPSPDTLR
jgi:hypothetical protein